jgi:4-hydroxyphenylpyruvate dioxygenase
MNNSSKDPLAIEAVEHVEIFCENGKLTAFALCYQFGFQPVGYKGPETGVKETASYLLRQNNINIIITSPLRTSNTISTQVFLHGTTVHDMALRVPDCRAFYTAAMNNGATSVIEPTNFDNNTYIRAAIKTYGDVIHSIVEKKDKNQMPPGFKPSDEFFNWSLPEEDLGLIIIDHMVGNVELGKMNHWVSFYEKVLGFQQMTHFTEDDISTEYSALMSKVMHNGDGKIKFPINEPAQGKRKSQIEEYLEFHNGPGVQHIALGTKDIIKTVSGLRKRGVQFLNVPHTYYDNITDRVGSIKEDMSALSSLGVLVDRDDDGYLLQLFTKPIHDRPTLFFEIIQREGSRGFGVGNFKALFEAIEREQARRGNL